LNYFLICFCKSTCEGVRTTHPVTEWVRSPKLSSNRHCGRWIHGPDLCVCNWEISAGTSWSESLPRPLSHKMFLSRYIHMIIKGQICSNWRIFWI